jgi:hypothetical protein
MRRCHLRGHENILKRQLIHVGAFNLSLILRTLLGAGTPREWRNRVARVFSQLLRFLLDLRKAVSRIPLSSPAAGPRREPSWPCRTHGHRLRFFSSSTVLPRAASLLNSPGLRFVCERWDQGRRGTRASRRRGLSGTILRREAKGGWFWARLRRDSLWKAEFGASGQVNCC